MNSEEKNEKLEIDIEEIRQKAIEEALTKRHKWRQKGTFIICESCDFKHGFYVPPHKMMVGEDEKGNPIIKDKRFVRKS